MEKFQELRNISKKKIVLADHILTQTFPLLKDPKLLLSALENIFLSYTNGVGSLLHYERLFKRIPNFQDSFEGKFRMLRDVAEKYGIKQEDINTIKEIKNIIVQHKKSPIEFSREDRFVICMDDYKMKTIEFKQLKNMMRDAKVFVEKISNITSKHEGIFK
jgi:hypothetical protein